MTPDDGWYFAYGSNLNMFQMEGRVGKWTEARRAVLSQYKLQFDCYSSGWHGYAANIVPTGNKEDRVFGAIYRITNEQLDILTTRHEHIRPSDISVEAEGETVPVKAYIFNPGESKVPPQKYLDTLLTGLRQHNYPETVIEMVTNIALG